MKNSLSLLGMMVCIPVIALSLTNCAGTSGSSGEPGYVTPGVAYYGGTGYYGSAYYGGYYGSTANYYHNSNGGYAVSNGYAGYAQTARGGSAAWVGDSGSAEGARGGSATWGGGEAR